MSCDGSYGFLTAADARKCSRDNSVIFEEICEIQQQILQAIQAKDYEVTVVNNTPMTGVGGIIDVTITNGGDDYEPIVAVPSVVHPSGINGAVTITLNGGTITGVTVTNGGSGYQPVPATISSIGRITNINASLTPVESGGAITSITINSAGQGYHAGDTIVVTHGTGVNCTAEVATVGALGEITGITITNGGSGYDNIGLSASITRKTAITATGTVNVNATTGAITGITWTNAGGAYHPGDQIFISHPEGFGALLQVQTIGAIGNITAVNIVTAGQDYQTVVAEIAITHPLGTLFRASVQVNQAGVITGVTVLHGGIGYNSLLPTITATDTEGSGATFTATVNNAGEISDITITNKGSNYTNATTMVVTPAPTSSGAGAILVPVIETYSNGYVYYSTFAGLVTNREIDDQIQFVLDYFTRLGYNIKAQVNPATNNTIQWHVMW